MRSRISTTQGLRTIAVLMVWAFGLQAARATATDTPTNTVAGAAGGHSSPIGAPVMPVSLPESGDAGLHGEAVGIAVAGEQAGTVDPWLRWLESLEATVATTTGQAHGESGLLYPLDAAPHGDAAVQPYRHLAIAKAVTQLESATEHRAKGRADENDGTGAGSPLLALANARNYLNLSEYDQALSWYGQAAARDADGHFRRETGREALAAAICARDTAAAGLAIASTMAAGDLNGREGEFVLAMRWLLSRRDGATLGWFVDRATGPELAPDIRVAFWRAYSLSWLERRTECLAEIRRVLDMGSRERALATRERGWLLTAYADLTLLEGSRDEAELRYRRLADSGVPALRDWGRLQSAGLAFLANRYGEAASGYREICQADAKGLWAEHACAMADIAAQLERLLSEGERYGAAAHYGH